MSEDHAKGIDKAITWKFCNLLLFLPYIFFFSLYKPDKYIQRLEHAVSVNWFRSEISFGFTKQIVMPKIVMRCNNSVKIPLHFCLFLSYECYFLFYVKEFICSIGLHTYFLESLMAAFLILLRCKNSIFRIPGIFPGTKLQEWTGIDKWCIKK